MPRINAWVQKGRVRHIERVLDRIDDVDVPDGGLLDPVPLSDTDKLRLVGRCRALTGDPDPHVEISLDHWKRRYRANRHLVARGQRWNVPKLTVRIKFPSVIAARDASLSDPAQRQPNAPMRAAIQQSSGTTDSRRTNDLSKAWTPGASVTYWNSVYGA